MGRRTQAQADDTRAELCAAARRLFASAGYARVSLAEIGAAAGATKGAIYHHFGDKESLFQAVWTQLQLEMDAAAQEAAIAGRSREDPYAAFLAGIRTYLDWTMREDYRRIVLADGPSVLGMERWHALDFELGQDNLAKGTQYLASKGCFPAALARPVAVMLQGALNGAGFALSSGAPGVTRDSVLTAFERLLRGLR
jgi:AcrR family transcriptional regulator